MSEKKSWYVVVSTGVALALSFGGLIYYQYTKLEEKRLEAERVRGEIETARALIAKTPELERDVLIHRETDSVVAEILPGNDDINNFVRTLRTFEESAGVKIVSLKEKAVSDRVQTEFDKVVYTLTFDGDGFQLLSFLNSIESHSRFMSVTSFKLTGSRKGRNDEREPRHKVTMDVETYVYAPKEGSREVKIESYERKRDLLLAEITRRRADLIVKGYDYRGPRGRRDPWIDPRIPAGEGDELVLSIEQQITLVDDLVERTRNLSTLWKRVDEAPNLVAKMKVRAEFDHEMALIEEEVRRVEDAGQLVFIPAERRFHTEVVLALEDLREQITGERGGFGPTAAELRETLDAMARHFDIGEFQLALQAFKILEPGLDAAERDDVRGPLVTRLREKAEIAQGVLAFERIELHINGVAIHDGLAPVAVINGTTVGVGEMLPDTEVIVQAIRRDEIEFGFRGLVLVRRIET